MQMEELKQTRQARFRRGQGDRWRRGRGRGPGWGHGRRRRPKTSISRPRANRPATMEEPTLLPEGPEGPTVHQGAKVKGCLDIGSEGPQLAGHRLEGGRAGAQAGGRARGRAFLNLFSVMRGVQHVLRGCWTLDAAGRWLLDVGCRAGGYD
jgi:hypothetical protein